MKLASALLGTGIVVCAFAIFVPDANALRRDGTLNVSVSIDESGSWNVWTYEVTLSSSATDNLTDFHINPRWTTGIPEGTPQDPDGSGGWSAGSGDGGHNWWTTGAGVAPGGTISFTVNVAKTVQNAGAADAFGTKDGDSEDEHNDDNGTDPTTAPKQ